MNKNLLKGLSRGRTLTPICLLALLAWNSVHAQTPLPQPSIQLAAKGEVYAAVTAPDGSVVIGGNFTLINGEARQHIARLRPDGTLDPNWNPGASCKVYSLAVDTSGAIYAGGCFSIVGGQSRTYIAKIDGSGAVDPSWNPQADYWVTKLALDGAGGIYAGGLFQHIGGQPRNHLAKLSTTGAGNADVDWNPNPTSANSLTISGLSASGSGALYVAGNFETIGGQARAGLAKLSTFGIGNADPTWNPNPSSTSDAYVRSIAVDNTGAVFVGGSFESIGGQLRSNIAKLAGSGAGAADATWNPGANRDGVDTLTFDGSGSLYAGGDFWTIGGLPRRYVAKLSTSGLGVVDPSWNPSADSVIETIALAGSGLVAVGGPFTQVGGQVHVGLALISSTGTALADADAERLGSARAFAAQPGGGMIVGGEFSRAGEQRRENILRLQADGTLDLTWNPGADEMVSTLAIGNSGAIYAGGLFGFIGGQYRPGFAKLSSTGNGAADPAWNSYTDCRSSGARLVIDGAGAIYASSCFSTIGGQSREGIAKLSGITGSADPIWDPGVDGSINALAIDGTGAVYAGGSFQNIGGEQRSNIAKLSGSGTGVADPGWNAMANAEVKSLAIDVDGSVYVGGYFSEIGGEYLANLAKLSGTNGAADANWGPGGCGVSSLLLDGNGALFTGGSCTRKLSTGGAGAGMGWNPNPNGEVTALALDASGNVYLGGKFTTVAEQPRSGLAAVPPSAPPIPSTERQVLLELYVNTGGDNWTEKSGWNGPIGSECSWYGITCEDSHVALIELYENNLVGTLPGLDPLIHLRVFSVSDNQLTGSIPLLSGLPNLTSLNFSRNQLSGVIPELSLLTNLRAFWASDNQLTGSIPSLSGMPLLVYASFSRNQLSGSIPALDTLVNLKSFSVSGNQLTGAIPALSNLTSLYFFHAGNNRLSGPLPAPPSPNNLQPGGSSVCPNHLSPLVDNAVWDTATGTTPWWSPCDLVFSTGFE